MLDDSLELSFTQYSFVTPSLRCWLSLSEMEAEPKEKRSKRSAGYGYGGLVNYGSAYGDDGYAGGYGGYAGGYNNGGHVSYDQTYSHSPVLTFVKGFRPGI